MAQKFTNAARAALSASISATDTSFSVGVALADLFPVADTNALPVPTVGKDWFKLTLQNSSGAIEIVYVRTRALGTAVMSNVIRGQEGTTAIAFLAGSVVGLRHTAADLAGAVDLASSSSAAGKAFLTALSAATQRTALGASSIGDAVFTAATPATAQAAIGAPALIQSQSAISATTTGTATAFLASVTPAVTANTPNSSFWINFHLAPGTASTLSMNGQGALPLEGVVVGGTYAAIPANAWQSGRSANVAVNKAGTAYIVDALQPQPVNLYGFNTVGQTIPSSQVDCLIGLFGTASDVTLPSLSTVPKGTRFTVLPGLNATIFTQGANTIFGFGAVIACSQYAPVVLTAFDSALWVPETLNQIGGVNQAWQVVSRALSTTYTNSTGRPIAVSIYWTAPSVVQGIITVNGQPADNTANVMASGGLGSSRTIVPINGTYSFAASGASVGQWLELR